VIGHWPARKTATYTRTGTAVPFIISQLPGGRAEAPFIASPAQRDALLAPKVATSAPITMFLQREYLAE
jgi:hypothetical protein